MTIELGILIAIVTAGIVVMTFYLNRMDKARLDAQKQTEIMTAVRTNMEHVLKSIERLEQQLIAYQQMTTDSIRRLHEKDEQHIKDYHSGKVG